MNSLPHSSSRRVLAKLARIPIEQGSADMLPALPMHFEMSAPEASSTIAHNLRVWEIGEDLGLFDSLVEALSSMGAAR